MEPFDLERALAGDPVVTGDGKEVAQLKEFDCGNGHEVIVGVLSGGLRSWTKEGKYNKNPSGLDLHMKPKKIKRWVNFHNIQPYIYSSEREARESAGPNAIAVAVPVEFEEGQGLNYEQI